MDEDGVLLNSYQGISSLKVTMEGKSAEYCTAMRELGRATKSRNPIWYCLAE